MRQYEKQIDDTFVLYYDLVDYDETFYYQEEIVSGKPVVAKVELEQQVDADVVLWSPRKGSRRSGTRPTRRFT